jgi:hypothetical protein
MGDGVEGNCRINMKVAASTGIVHLSWDQELANELRITGDRAEAVIGLGSVDELSIRRLGEGRNYEKVKAQVAFPMTTNGKTEMGIPRMGSDCFHFQIVQMIRSIQLGEDIPVTGEGGAQVISIIEECYRIARPIDMPWLPPSQNYTYKSYHWRNMK